MSRFTKEEKSWMLYDWASSAYTLIISTAVFPLFYKASATNAGVDAADSTAYLGYTISFATLILALIAPILGTIADYQGFKKKFFTSFYVIGIAVTLSLAFVPSEQWIWLLILYTVAVICSSGSNIFYDAFLVDVTPESRMSLISARGYGLGYIGSTIPFIMSIALILLAQKEILPINTTVASQASFVVTAAWWGLFSIPFQKNVHQIYYIPRDPNPISSGFKRLFSTFREIKKYRALFLFLLAYFFYIDGVGTIITMSTAYGSDLGISSTTLLIVLLVTQIVAAPFSILYGKLAARFSEKKMLYLASSYIWVSVFTPIFLKRQSISGFSRC